MLLSPAIKTAGYAATVSPSGKANSVHETKAEFQIEFQGDLSATFCLPIRARPLLSETKTMRSNISDKSRTMSISRRLGAG